ncbi:DNA translocase FtsK 1-like [Sinocyclocheilus rhinocerous]|uniref:DNA translocase FtsK 1-like n=1 Tax=Sinocyclocheilus rhinocerous TaxID=307959 RepID=UPI0007BA6FEE|nr:PREDICTED: DNA translocase FtsK 1-like [Sinocyclocheilus rhinocerous]
MAALLESHHVSTDLPESRHDMAAISESAHVKPESPAKMAATPESPAKMAATPEPLHVPAVTKISSKDFLAGGYSTQAHANAELGRGLKRLIASVMDPPLMSVRAADIPVVPTLSSPPGIPLSTALPVMAVAILSVWAAHCAPESSPVHKSTPEASPVHESAPEASPVHESAPESAPEASSVLESAPEASPAYESVSEASPIHESVSSAFPVPEPAAEPPEVSKEQD